MSELAQLAERVWHGSDPVAVAARGALTPAALLFEAALRVRARLFERGVLATHLLALPALSVGNLTVGGTGKTPVAAWFARRLREAGAKPAIVLRGYGGDEPLVHRMLDAHVEIVVDADRVAGTLRAAALGADVVVLDDAFQHRRARREIDVVLLAAERAHEAPRLLPAGPYREPFSALRRASAVIVTRKSGGAERVAAVIARVTRSAPGLPIACIALSLEAMRSVDDHGTVESLASLDGARVLAIAGIGAPEEFFAQLRACGAHVDGVAYADHHAYSADDAMSLARRAAATDRVVCTLKDAVKLRARWPRLAPTLWYVSQRVAVERGGDVIDDLVARLLAARDLRTEFTGSGRPS